MLYYNMCVDTFLYFLTFLLGFDVLMEWNTGKK
jgi:hypothetical protein